MASLLGLYGGSRRRIHAKRTGGGGGGGRAWWSAAAPVRQLFWKVKSRWRNAVLRPRRRAPARFGYDLQSYSHNFDDGLVSGHQF